MSVQVTPAAPAGVPAAKGYNVEFSSNNFLALKDIHKPEVDPNYYSRYGNEWALVQFMDVMDGRKASCRNEEVFHYEKDWTHQSIKFAASSVGSGAGALTTLTIHADSHSQSGNRSYPKVGQHIMFKGQANAVRGRIMAKRDGAGYVNANELDVAPLKAADIIPAVSNGDFLIVYTNSKAEGTGQPETTGRDAIKVRSRTQIIADTYTITGSGMTSQAWIRPVFIGPDSPIHTQLGIPSGNYWFAAESKETYIEFLMAREMALLLGQETDNPLITAGTADSQHTTTEGLLSSIHSGGILPAGYTVGSYGLSDLQALTNLVNRENGSQEYLFCQGMQLRQEYDVFATGLFQNGAVVYHAFDKQDGSSAKDRALSYGVKSIEVDNYTFHLKRYDMFNSPMWLGAAGYDWTKYGFGIPLDKQTIKNAENKTEDVFSCRMLYRGDDAGYSREMEVWPTGGVNGVYTNQLDRMDINYRSEVALQTVNINRFFLVYSA